MALEADRKAEEEADRDAQDPQTYALVGAARVMRLLGLQPGEPIEPALQRVKATLDRYQAALQEIGKDGGISLRVQGIVYRALEETMASGGARDVAGGGSDVRVCPHVDTTPVHCLCQPSCRCHQGTCRQGTCREQT